jgi:branched-chain amino acid transport system substrate-binding protein
MKLVSIVFLALAQLSVAAGKEIAIGAIFPMTGPIATYGQESVNGINLALKKINKSPIHGKTIKIILEDNKGESVDSANAARKLIQVDHVTGILGSVASSNTLASAPIAQEEKIPLLTPASTNEAVTTTGDYIFRTCFTDAFQGMVMAKFATVTLKRKKAAIIVDLSSDYSKGLAKVFKEKFMEMKGTVIPEEFSYNQKDTDFRTLLRKVARTNPDVIFLPGYYTEVGLILNQARQQGINIPFLGGDGWHSESLQKLAGDGITGNYYSSHFSPDDTDPRVVSFVREYQAVYGTKPGAMAALGYDGIMVMADALSRTKNLDSNELKNALAAVKNFPGVTGMITLDKNRNAFKSAVVLETTKTGTIFKTKINP